MGKNRNKKQSTNDKNNESLEDAKQNVSSEKNDLIPVGQKRSKNQLKKLKNKKSNGDTKNMQLEKRETKAMLNVEDELESTNGQELETNQKTDHIEQDVSLEAFLWLLVFSVLMFTFPFVTFYGVHSWLQESFQMSNFHINCYSVFASVLVVNFIIMLFVYKAFKEDCRPLEEKLQKN